MKSSNMQKGAMALLAGFISMVGAITNAQGVEAEAIEPLSQEALEALVAPVALYPDDLLAIVLPASTFPLQVVQASRFLKAREEDPGQQPDEHWNEAIVALLNYPEALELLNEDLDWTWRLGSAMQFQETDVINAIAAFRDKARLAGNLQSDAKQQVSLEGGAMAIKPAVPDEIYVPYYEPAEVVVRQPARVYHYYPRPYPVYYYPYHSSHRFTRSAFWGVTSAFSIGWRTGHVHWHHHGFADHPYYGYRYYDPFYIRRPHLWLSFHDRNLRQRHIQHRHKHNRWRSRGHRRGARPNEGRNIDRAHPRADRRNVARRGDQPERRPAGRASAANPVRTIAQRPSVGRGAAPALRGPTEMTSLNGTKRRPIPQSLAGANPLASTQPPALANQTRTIKTAPSRVRQPSKFQGHNDRRRPVQATQSTKPRARTPMRAPSSNLAERRRQLERSTPRVQRATGIKAPRQILPRPAPSPHRMQRTIRFDQRRAPARAQPAPRVVRAAMPRVRQGNKPRATAPAIKPPPRLTKQQQPRQARTRPRH